MCPIFQNFKMPKPYKKCTLCANNNYTNKDIVIFTTADHGFVCENHFTDDDMRPHQGSKRFNIELNVP